MLHLAGDEIMDRAVYLRAIWLGGVAMVAPDPAADDGTAPPGAAPVGWEIERRSVLFTGVYVNRADLYGMKDSSDVVRVTYSM